MAAPTPVTNQTQQGHNVHLLWDALWTDGNQHTDKVVLDLSALNFTDKIKIQKVGINASTGIDVRLELDAGTDELVASHPLGASGAITYDFRDTLNGGIVGSGDLLLTSLSGADGDRVMLEVLARTY